MKKYWLALVLAVVLFLTNTDQKRGVNTIKPLVIAHRGASSLAPENTMAAIDAALKLGVDALEIDIHLSQDGHLVVLHDDTVTRTTSGSGKVRNLTLEQLQELDAGSWFGTRFQGERIPTLRQVLEAVQDKAVLLIELKGKDTEDPLVELVQELNLAHQVIFQSFDLRQIEKTKQKAPDIPTLFLVRSFNNGEDLKSAVAFMEQAEKAGASGLALRHNLFSPQIMTLAAERNLMLFVWTVDNKNLLQKFSRAGVQGIITNRPQDLLQILP